MLLPFWNLSKMVIFEEQSGSSVKFPKKIWPEILAKLELILDKKWTEAVRK